MTAKFKVGNLVKLNHRELATLTHNKAQRHSYKNILFTPDPELLKLIDRRRARRIVKIVYDTQGECNLYYLGTNHRGKADSLSTIAFRSYQLNLITESHRIGRPRQKRKYTKSQTTVTNIVDFAVKVSFINKRLESIIGKSLPKKEITLHVMQGDNNET